MSIAERIGEVYGRQSDEASIVGCGLDRYESEYGIKLNTNDIDKMIQFYYKYKNEFKKLDTINAKREAVKLIYAKDWETISLNGFEIANEDKTAFFN